MAQYTVQHNQNLFDISIELYGSIEGIYDLLISNPGLSMEDELQAGMNLEYHDYFVINQNIVDEIKAQGLKPINGERHVYHKSSNFPLVFQICIPSEEEFSVLNVAGEGDMIVDWGDNTDLQTIHLSHSTVEIEHFFDNLTEKG